MVIYWYLTLKNSRYQTGLQANMKKNANAVIQLKTFKTKECKTQ